MDLVPKEGIGTIRRLAQTHESPSVSRGLVAAEEGSKQSLTVC